MASIRNPGIWFALLTALAASACGPAEDGGLVLQINTPPSFAPAGLRAEVPQQIKDAITDFRICVSAENMSKAKCENFNLADYEQRGKARIGGLPPGKNRKVTFQGYDRSWEVHYCGEIAGVEIRDDATTQVGMFISKCRDFTVVGEMASARVFHTATLLEDGRVLLAGGFNTISARESCTPGGCRRLEAVDTIDLYDPTTGLFDTDTGLRLNHPRGLHTATTLPDGRILIAGGCQNAIYRTEFSRGLGPVIEVDGSEGWGLAGTQAEIIDVAGGTVQEVSSPMDSARALHRALPLPNGDVFLLGGIGPNGTEALASGAYFLTATREFVAHTGAMSSPRQAMALVPFGSEGHALVWGGNRPSSAGPGVFAEILSVTEQGEVTIEVPGMVTEQTDMGIPAFYPAGVQLPSGKILVTGGMVIDTLFDPHLTDPRALREYRLLDVTSGEESILAPQEESHTMGLFACMHTATLLDRLNKVDGKDDPEPKVLIAGGLTLAQPQDVVFEPQQRVMFFLPWENENNYFLSEQITGNAIALNVTRAGHTATAMDDGTVLLAGGLTGTGDQLAIANSAEVFNASSRSLRRE